MMIRQLNINCKLFWICLELTSFRIAPTPGKQDKMIFFYWLFGGIQIGLEKVKDENLKVFSEK
jgi:hypothetical protein